jgi:hypothetical protein
MGWQPGCRVPETVNPLLAVGQTHRGLSDRSTDGRNHTTSHRRGREGYTAVRRLNSPREGISMATGAGIRMAMTMRNRTETLLGTPPL